MKYLQIAILAGLALTAGNFQANATHLRAGQITVKRKDCNSLTYTIIIRAYTNTGSQVRYEGGELRFGDSKMSIRPRIENTDLGNGIGFVKDSVEHTFPGPGRYVITYRERNRNATILNIGNPVDTPFYLETVIFIDPTVGCDNSPDLLVPPIDKGCTGAAWYHNPGAYDLDGDSLSYEFAIPKQDKGITVLNYRDPNAKEFYDKIGIDYSKANETGDGPPTFTIDAGTGTIEWNAPGVNGEYNIAFRVIQWRKVGTQWKQIGYVTRDMQIIIEDCKNNRPELDVPKDTCVVAGSVLHEFIYGRDIDIADQLKVEAFSEVFTLNPSPAQVIPSPAVFTSTRPAPLEFTWATKCNHVKDQPYQVVFKVSDKPAQGPSLVGFKTWRIKVIAPKPIITTATLDIANRAATVNWQPYSCAPSADSIEVWRRVDSFAGMPGDCETGMPASFGYTKIATVSSSLTSYKDEKLASGAKYCYRLVASFPDPKGGKSIVSDEICVPPFKLDVPVTTKVSINNTSATDGIINVNWVEPLEADPAIPRPFKYEVFRAEGFSGDANSIKITPSKINATSIVDEGMNTKDKVYNYKITAYDDKDLLVGTSVSASTVRLEITSRLQELELRWSATVPWSNNAIGKKHIIYRGLEGDPLVKIAEVNPNQGFVYTDIGLDNSKVYCYRVETIGSYGNPNPAIPSELRNYSQIMCAQPDDQIKPCKPTFSVDLKGTDCDLVQSCADGKVFSNRLVWDAPKVPCKLSIQRYVIYYASKVGGQFDSLTFVPGSVTEYEDKNLLSFARCYKIVAVDRAGNRSELSDSFCFDNCPYYELPNVFTPNGDKCNDLFSAYNIRNINVDGGTVTSECGILQGAQLEQIQKKCARFVQSVSFTVFNRWGGEVFTYQSGGERTIYIDWDGRDTNGKDLSAGVYYYEAQVVFDVVDPSKRNKTIRGWVQIIR